MDKEQRKSRTRMSVQDYARMRGRQPQLIHYYIRQDKIEYHDCVCGRPVIDVKEVDEFFAAKDKPKEEQ